MRRVEIFVSLDDDEGEAVARAARQVGAQPSEASVTRRSLDARKGHAVGWHLQVEIGGTDGDEPEDVLPPPARARAGLRVVVVGAGPCGTFAALRLADAGARVTIVDAGKPVQPRRHDLAALTQRGELDPWSNYCFGEGGAGTFSDGKLYTRTKDRRGVRSILRALVSHGAEPSILVESRPHVGSNKLPKILTTLREALEARGVEYAWSDPVIDLLDGAVAGVRCASGRELAADAVVLAVGHSARALYERLAARGVAMEAKAFAVGARIEHAQPLIDRIQYGRAAGHPRLPPAFYHVTAQAAGRGVYSFCMCPGGWIVDSSTEQGALCTNGMSLSRRDSPLANSALVVTVEPRDFGWAGGSGVLARFERALPGFAREGAQFVGVETRSSAPVRLLRDAGLASPSHARLYPAGEGAGYAGGIISAALDGLRVADAILAAGDS